MAMYYYVRVSTTDQHTDNQIADIARKYAAPDAIYSDDGISGTKHPLTRPGFKDLLSVLAEGDTVIITAIDRLGRNVDDVRAMAQLFIDKGCTLISMREGCDFSTAAGKLVFTMLAAVAEMERSLLVERTKSGMQQAKERGSVLGKREGDAAREARQLLAAGHTVAEVISQTGLSRSAVYKIKGKI